MSDLLEELLGKTVEVHSRGGRASFKDAGILTAYDERWIKLDKGDDGVLYFPVVNIRLVKPFECVEDIEL